MAEARGVGRVFRTHDIEYAQDPPKHRNTRGWPLVNPRSCPGAQLEFHITEIMPDGAALDDVHEKEDHVFFVLSGRAAATVGGQVFEVGPGDALYVPRGCVHAFRILGGEVLRIGVVFAPARDIWG